MSLVNSQCREILLANGHSQMTNKTLDVLAIGAHPDDVEIGMGASLIKLKQEGCKTGILDLTDGEPTPFGTPEKRKQEREKAAEQLNLDFRKTLDLPNRYLQDTIEAREKVAAVLRETRPRLLFFPHWEDAHPDHKAAFDICEASRFYSKLTKSNIKGEPYYPLKIFYYFASHSRVREYPSFIMDISDLFEQKIELVKRYESQFVENEKNQAIFDNMRHRAQYWGGRIRVKYGEPFLSKEELGLKSFNNFL